MKTILVTGGAGFIGSHLCDKLIESGNAVICLDNLLTGSQRNIAHLLSSNNFYFVNQDACLPFKSKRGLKVDEIYHLASPADPNSHSPISYMAYPFETMRVNTVGTWNMCELAIKHGAKLFFASTSEVYGNPEKSPQSETYRGNVSTTGPRAVYDEAKRFGETIISAFVREKEMDGLIVRIFNTYGPGMNIEEGRAVVNFIRQAVRDEPITIYGDGRQTRSFCYIDDQIEGLIKAMESAHSHAEIFNIGNPDEITIVEFAKHIKKLSGSKSEIIYSEPFPTDDPRQRKPDIKKARDKLGWHPKTSLKDGLKRTIEYFRKSL